MGQSWDEEKLGKDAGRWWFDQESYEGFEITLIWRSWEESRAESFWLWMIFLWEIIADWGASAFRHPRTEISSPFFPTCQVRVVRFYVNSRASFSASSASSPDLNYDDHSRVFAAGPQPRPSTPSVRCRTSTTTSHAHCSLPDLNHDQPRPVFAAGPQPRPATPSVRCRTSTTTSHAQCSLPDLNHDQPRPVFAAGPQPRPATPSVRFRTSTTTSHAQCSLPDLNRQKICQIECQKIWQIECQKIYRQNVRRYAR